MVSTRSMTYSSLVLCVALAFCAVLRADWMWFVVDLVSILILMLPRLLKADYFYSGHTVGATMLAPVLAVVMFLVNEFVYPIDSHILLDVGYMEYVGATLQCLQCFVSGFMLSLVMDRSFGMTLSKRWMVLFAMMFSLAVSVIDLFFMFGSLYVDGAPVFNGDFQYGQERYSNRILIVSPFVATFASAVYAVVAVKVIKKCTKADFTYPLEAVQ